MPRTVREGTLSTQNAGRKSKFEPVIFLILIFFQLILSSEMLWIVFVNFELFKPCVGMAGILVDKKKIWT